MEIQLDLYGGEMKNVTLIASIFLIKVVRSSVEYKGDEGKLDTADYLYTYFFPVLWIIFLFSSTQFFEYLLYAEHCPKRWGYHDE